MPAFDPSRLRQARLDLGLNAEQSAVAIGRTVSAYMRYEAGTTAPSIDTVCRIADFFGLPVETFFDPDRPGFVLSREQHEAIKAQVRGLPPLTDDQIDGIAAIIARTRVERREQQRRVS